MGGSSHAEVGLFAFGETIWFAGKCYQIATIPVYGAESPTGDHGANSEIKPAGRWLIVS